MENKTKEIEKKEHTIMEGNLLEYPIFSMKKGRVDKTIEEYIWEEKTPDGEIIKRKFKKECAAGVPNYFDMDVFNGIMRIYVKSRGDQKKNEIHFTIYELIKELELTSDGRTINRVRESLERMAKTSLHFEEAFYTKKEKMTVIVHLIVRIEIYEKQKGDRVINAIKVVLDDELVNSIEKKYYNLIDFKIYKSLNSGIPRRLYEYLEKKKYRKNQFEINIKKLAGWLGLKTSKVSQLKELLGKANNELKEKEVIDKWRYQNNNMVYYFHKSERFKEVEDSLFYLEELVVTFYQGLGQEKVPEVLRREGMIELQNLIDEGYTKEEVAYALGWAADNIKEIHSIKIISKVIGQAMGDKESKRLVEEKTKAEQQKRIEEDKKIEEDRKRGAELDKIFEGLPRQRQTEIEEKARENLIERGFNPKFMLPTLIRIERNNLLKEKKSLVKKDLALLNKNNENV